jgi:Domain of unknown function (DUF4111)
MHARLLTSGLSYATRLEGFYLPQAALRRSDPANARYPFNAQADGLLMVELGSDWVIQRHLVRETAIVLWGPPPQTLLDPVLPSALRAVVIDRVTSYWNQQLDHPEWLRTREFQAFAILTMCRALYTLACGEVVSKPRAAAWAREALGTPWVQLIDRALLWRHDSRSDDMTDMLHFVRYTIARRESQYLVVLLRRKNATGGTDGEREQASIGKSRRSLIDSFTQQCQIAIERAVVKRR